MFERNLLISNFSISAKCLLEIDPNTFHMLFVGVFIKCVYKTDGLFYVNVCCNKHNVNTIFLFIDIWILSIWVKLIVILYYNSKLLIVILLL